MGQPFHERICIFETINAHFQSLFCQNLSINTNVGLQENFVFDQLNICIISGPF